MTTKLKMIAMAAALGAGLAGVAVAGADGLGRNGGRGRMGAERVQQRVERMRADLNLSDDQARRIEQILTDAANARGRWTGDRGDRNGDYRNPDDRNSDGSWQNDDNRDAAREQMRQQRRETMDRINAVLTPEQRDRFAEMQRERRQRHQDGGDRRRDRQDDRNF
jgi:Spy/CpxP family protein refolding chaperone